VSYKYLEHSTDALIEVTASNLTKAFEIAGRSVVQTIMDDSKIDERMQKNIVVKGKNLHYLLYNWLEEMIILTITDGFATKRFSLIIEKEPFLIKAKLFGEEIDIKKHGFKVEIKSPTFHEMEIDESNEIRLKYLLDL
tara:strand:- start:2230 stop:2643 length:414 start_codon:yes stop_codon:yes gene_type:complete